MLSCFEKLNGIMNGYDPYIFEYYEMTRMNLINILNEIVDNYVYKKPSLVDRKELDEVIDQLKTDNSKLKDKVSILKTENTSAAELITKLKSELESKTARLNSYNLSKGNDTMPADNKASVIKEYSVTKYSTTSPNDNTEKRANFLESANKDITVSNLLFNLAQKELHQPVTHVNLKTLSLKQLKDFIQEVYEGKVVYDAVCKKENKVKETLEQYVYTHLRNKYGLNNIVAEWVHALIEGLKTYMGRDNDIALFALVS